MKSETVDQAFSNDKLDQGQTLLGDNTDNLLINVEISDVLTPVTCALLINEILQGLLYQKSQIPYPYTWMKSAVEKKRVGASLEEAHKRNNFSAASHFRIVSTAYDTLERIMKGIITEFTDKSDCIKEVLFVFGPTPNCPKEIYSIKISSLAKGHLERIHANPVCKYRQKILRNIFLSQHWLDAMDNNMTCTNTYIFIKTSEFPNRPFNLGASDNGDKFFILSQPITVAPKVKHMKISLNYEYSGCKNCCDNFFVFEDVSESNVVKENLVEQPIGECGSSAETFIWYQSKELFKGFKDSYVNKVSVSELW